MGIKDVLEHSWIQKFTKTNLTEKRRGSKDLTLTSTLISMLELKTRS